MVVERRASRPAPFISVELNHVRLRLGGRPVLRDVSWRIRPGERWILMGGNGAGKTQLLKTLAGDVWPDPAPRTPRRYVLGAQRFDDPYGIREEISYLGPERQDRYEHYGWNHSVLQIVGTGLHRTDIPLDPLSPAERSGIRRLLASLGILQLARRRFLTLSYGERRLVLLARALAWRPRLLLLDEPFSGLDPLNRERLAAGLRALSRSRLPWVLSTHRPEELSIRATHLCRIDAGRIVSRRRLEPSRGTRSAARTRGRMPPRPPSGRRARDPSGQRLAARVLIGLRRANIWREGVRVLRHISLDIAAGDCWVVHGANGSGKSSLIRALYGDLGVARGGHILREGIEPGVPLSEFQRRVGLVAPELQALYPRRERVEDVVASGMHASIGLNAAAGPAERRRVRSALRAVGALSLLRRTLRTLSYGQMRRVLFARALVNQPDILLLDEPYAGLDARTRNEMLALIERAVSAGVSTVITTHHDDEWPAAASHELELAAGAISYCGPVRGR